MILIILRASNCSWLD